MRYQFCDNPLMTGIEYNNVLEKRRGVILLMGPSCGGKGEMSKILSDFFSIPKERCLSMGDILRKIINDGRTMGEAEKYKSENRISSKISIFDEYKNPPHIISEARKYRKDILTELKRNGNFISQLDWLEFCVLKGLLVPDDWTKKIINTYFEDSTELRDGLIILDGYPRTCDAAQDLICVLRKYDIPLIKILHLFITKEQMVKRALERKRADDTMQSLESRYKFYIDKVQPSIDYLKHMVGTDAVVLIDAHKPVYDSNGQFNKKASIDRVAAEVKEVLLKCLLCERNLYKFT